MKYLNFEGLQYFYSKLSSSLASQYVSLGNLKTINGQSLIGTGNITIEGGASGDYLPLSGGALTGNLVMGEMGDILFMDHESKLVGGIQTESDRAPVNSRGNYSTIYCNYADNSAEGQLSPGSLSLTDRGEFIYVRPSGIEKNGGSPTEVFATDGSVVDMNTYLPLGGGTMTGDIEYMSPNSSVLCSIGTLGDVAHNNATGLIACDNIGSGVRTIIQGCGLRAYAQNSSDTAQPYLIEYFYDNIYIYFHQDSSTTRKYKFNIQKLIDDGYLIEE